MKWGWKLVVGIMTILVVMMFCYVGAAMADSGTYDGISWDLTDGVLTLGNGGTQTLENREHRYRDSDWPWHSQRSTITSVVTNGKVILQGSVEHMFSNLSNLESFDASGFDVSRVTETRSMFAYTTISGVLDLTGWDVSHVETTSSMFLSFTGNLVMPDMQWQSLTATDGMFNSHYGDLEISNWSFGSLTTMGYLFVGAQGNVDAVNWNLDGVETMGNIFRNHGKAVASEPSVIDVSGWHSTTVTSATACFANSSGIKEIDVSNWNMPALVNVSEFIGACYSLKRVIGFDTWDVSHITDMSWFFRYASALSDIGDISQWDTSNVIEMPMMFLGTSIQDLDLSGWDVSNATNFSGIFSSTSKLQTLDLSGWCDITPYYNGSVSGTSNNSLIKITLGDQWRMKSEDGSKAILFDLRDGVEVNGVVYSDYWYHESRKYGPFRSTSGNGESNAFLNNYTPEMAGTWLREPKYYTIHFVPLHTDASGEMEDVQAIAHGSFTLPSNVYQLYEHEFVYWQDENGNQYGDENTIQPGTYLGGDTITLTAVLKSTAEYTIQFVAEDATGSMAQVITGIDYDYQIPENQFAKFDYDFDHWDDGKGHTYADGDLIPEDTYAKDELVTLTAVFVKRAHNVQMDDGTFTFSIKKDETAVFDPIPANTGYQVYEQVPGGWLLVQRVDAFGVIEALNKFDAVFLNQHDPEKVTVQFNGLKLMDGVPAEPESFTFELWGEEGYIQSKPVGLGGMVQFDPIAFMMDDVGEHHYVIKERIGEDDTTVYDGHEEHITVTVYREGSTVYAHTDNIDDRGNKLSDYVSNQRYSKIITIPGAESLHVRLKYTNVRGPFYIWAGEHNEVLTGSFSASCNTLSMQSASNPGGYYRYFPYQSGKDQEYLYDEFDIPGDSLSIWYYSYAYDVSQGYYPNGPYSDMVNYGYYMAIGDGYLTAMVDVDDDGIKFENTSKPGKLVLQKLGTDNDVQEGTFYYEVQFYTANGMTYELPDSVITYEQRDGLSQDFPDLDVSANPAYNLCVNEIKLLTDGSSVVTTERYQYKAGSVYSISEVPGFIVSAIEGADVVQTQSGWQGVMLAEDTEINVYYSEPTMVSGNIVWKDNNNIDGKRPGSTTVHLIRDDASIDYVIVSEDDNWEFSFENLPLLDRNGNVIAYSVMMEADWQDDDPYYMIIYDSDNIIAKGKISLRITDVTLLSEEEYTEFKDNIPLNSDGWWWLRSPGDQNFLAEHVIDDGSVHSSYVYYDGACVRPALICDLGHSNLSIGDKISLAGYNWTVINTSVNITDDPYNGKAIILCDYFVGNTPFRTDTFAADANVYAVSDVKVWLENWATEKGVMPESDFLITDVTLLSQDEYVAYKDVISLITDNWWLRSLGPYSAYASVMVDNHGEVNTQYWSSSNSVGVRPVILCDLSSSNYSVGDQISLAGYSWTVLNNSMILCDGIVGRTAFRAEYSAPDSNDYDASDVKQWLANWVATHPFWTKTVMTWVVE